jgi:hypothetical protein
LVRVVGFRNAGNKRQWVKPLQQLANLPAGLHLYCGSSSSSPTAAGCLELETAAAAAAAAAAGGGDGKNKASWCIKSPTAAEFFSRYPALHSFMLHQVQAAAAIQQQQQGQQQQQSGQGKVPPTLFPVLMILTRLKPSLLLLGSQNNNRETATGTAITAAAAAAVPHLAPDAFLPSVLAVGKSCVMGVRQMAAAALPALVQSEQLHAVCVSLAQQLAQVRTGNAAGDAAAAARAGKTTMGVSQNELHGILLQLTALLTAVAATSSNSRQKSSRSSDNVAALVSDLLPAFVGSSWLANSSSRAAAAVRQAYVAAAGQLLMLATTHLPTLMTAASGTSCSTGSNAIAADSSSSCVTLLWELLLALTETCDGAVQQMLQLQQGAGGTGEAGLPTGQQQSLEVLDPQHCCWLRDSVQLWLGPLLLQQLQLAAAGGAGSTDRHSSASDGYGHGCFEAHGFAQQVLLLLKQRLVVCMQCCSYEVRAAALKSAAVVLDKLVQLQLVVPDLLLPLQQTAHDEMNFNRRTVSAGSGVMQDLETLMWAALESECTVKVLQRLLLVIGQLQQLRPQQQQQQQASSGPLLPAEIDLDLAKRLELLIKVGRQCRQVEVCVGALQCAGWEMQTAVAAALCQGGSSQVVCSSNNSNSRLLQLLAHMVQWLSSCAAANQPEEVRKAAAQALGRCGLLQPLVILRGDDGHIEQHSSCDCASSSSRGNSPAAGTMHAAVVEQSLAAWGVALKLMEDEEDDTRQAAAQAAQAALQPIMHSSCARTAASGGGSAMTNHSVSTTAGCTAVDSTGQQIACIGQYVEAVEQQTFLLLVSSSSRWPQLQPRILKMLATMVFDVSSATAVPAVLLHQGKQHAAGRVAAPCHNTADASKPPGLLAGVLVRKLFEKEADNHHEEPVLLAQHAAAAMCDICRQHGKEAQGAAGASAPQAGGGAGAHVLDLWFEALLAYLVEVSEKLSGSSRGSAGGGWVGGGTNHPEVFVPLYRCLLGIWVVLLQLQLTTCSCGQQGPPSTVHSTSEQLPQQQQQQHNYQEGSKVIDSRLAASREGLQQLEQVVDRLLQLQPTVLLQPLLQELQAAVHLLPLTHEASNLAGAGGQHCSTRGRDCWKNKVLFLLTPGGSGLAFGST